MPIQVPLSSLVGAYQSWNNQNSGNAAAGSDSPFVLVGGKFQANPAYTKPVNVNNLTIEETIKNALANAQKMQAPLDTNQLQNVRDSGGNLPQVGSSLGQLQQGGFQIQPDISSDQKGSIASASTVLDAIDQARNLLKDNSIDTGRSQLVKQKLRTYLGPSFPGLSQSDSEQQLTALLNSISANYLNALSGKQVSDKEQERLSKLLPSLSDTKQELDNKLKILEQETKINRSNIVKAAKDPIGTASGANDPLGLFK